MGFYIVYILKHKIDGTLYKGYTSKSINVRLEGHKNYNTRTTAKKGANYELVWYCAFPTKKQAIIFEKYLKSGSGRAFTNKRLI